MGQQRGGYFQNVWNTGILEDEDQETEKTTRDWIKGEMRKGMKPILLKS